MTKCHGLGGLKSRNMIFTVTESGWSKAVVRVGSPEASRWLVDGIFFLLCLPGLLHVCACVLVSYPEDTVILIGPTLHTYFNRVTPVKYSHILRFLESRFDIQIWGHSSVITPPLPARSSASDGHPLPQASTLFRAATLKGA